MSKPKISRSALKAVIKECLVEILAEGIGSNQVNLSSRGSTQKRIKKKAVRNLQESQRSSSKFEGAVQKASSNLTSDPVMAAIFEDTARTTLQEQREMPSAQTQTHAARDTGPVNPGNPEDMFEGSSNWATLAFAEKKTV